MTLEQLGTIGALIFSLIAMALAILESRPKRLKMNAETSQIFQDMLAEELEKSIAKDKTVVGLKKRIASLEAEVAALYAINKELEQHNKDLRHWAEALVEQVVSLHGTPVQMSKRKTK